MKNIQEGREEEEAENFSKEDLDAEGSDKLDGEKHEHHSGDDSDSDEWDLLQTNKNRLVY